MNQTLGAFIKQKREAKDLTLRGAAAYAKVSHPYWSQVESDQEMPSSKWLGKIAATLGVTKRELLEKAEQIEPLIVKEDRTVYETKPVIDGHLMSKHEIEVIRALRKANDREKLKK